MRNSPPKNKLRRRARPDDRLLRDRHSITRPNANQRHDQMPKTESARRLGQALNRVELTPAGEAARRQTKAGLQGIAEIVRLLVGRVLALGLRLLLDL